MKNKCPKCKIYLDRYGFENIAEKDDNILSLKSLFGKVVLDEADIWNKGYCDLCNATYQQITMHRF